MDCTTCGGELLSGICPSCEATRTPSGGASPSASEEPQSTDGGAESLPETWADPAGGASPQKGGPRPPAERKPRRGAAGGVESRRRFEPGTLLASRYRIVSALGRGGMGEVYRADDLKLGETVALKFLPESVERDPRRLASLLEEARVARKVSHPNICRVHDIAETDEGLHFISMEYIDGEDLSSLLRRIGRVPRSKALEIARESLQALASAHDAGILHRDLKPANLMLDGAGRVRVTDFGLASAIGTAASGGTPAYMAPELHLGQRGSVQSDLYALGLVFYELFTGQRPFRARSREELERLHRKAEPIPPSELVPELDSELEALILQCLRKDPARRPASLVQLDRVLAKLQRRSGVDVPKVGDPQVDATSLPSSVFGVDSRTRRGLFGLLGAAVIAYLITVQPWQWWGSGGGEASGTATPGSPPEASEIAETAVEVRPGLALLPIRNLTRESDSDWIGLAISEALFTELSIAGTDRIVPLPQVHTALGEIGLLDKETYTATELARIQRRLGVARVLMGSFAKVGGEDSTMVRLDVRVLDTGTGTLLDTDGATGTQGELFDLVQRIGSDLRSEGERLGPEDSLAIRAALPSDPEATRLYVEGRAAQHRLDFGAARDLFVQAVAIEPEHPMLLAALAEVWWKLGYEERARVRVSEAANGSETLGVRQRQEILARAAMYDRRFDEAASLYGGLVRNYPDELDYRVDRIEAQIAGGALNEALLEVSKARRLPSPLGDHPILDHVESQVHERQGNYREQQQFAQHAAEKGEAIESTALVAAARLREASALRRLGDSNAAVVAMEQARALYEGLGDTAGVARVLERLGNARYQRGDLVGAKTLLLQALELFEQIGHELNVAGVYNNLANVESLEGDIESAKTHYELASEIFRRLDRGVLLGRPLNNLAGIELLGGRLDEALKLYQEALALFNAMENRSQSAITLTNFGEALTFLGQLEEARQTFQEARALAGATGDKDTQSYSSYRLAELYRMQGDLFVAKAQYEEALEILGDIKAQLSISEIHLGQARVALEEGQLDSAETLAAGAEEVFRSVGAKELRALAEGVLIDIVLDRDRLAEAERRFETLRSDVASIDWLRVRYDVSLLEARLRRAQNRPSDALAVLDGLVAETRASLYLGYQLEAEVLAAEITVATGDAATPSGLEDLVERAEAQGYGGLASRARRLE